uniref:TMEM205-like domain-containing protein n=1 Tax=Kalanchoe fedtschenkoi TaxID=63787 RepID=A0A7N0UWY5_KALFE
MNKKNMPVKELLLLYLITVAIGTTAGGGRDSDGGDAESAVAAGEGITSKTHSREVACDAAVGKCKHRLASSVSAAKERAEHLSRQVAEEAKEAAKDAFLKAAGAVYEKSKEVGSDVGAKIAHKAIQGTKGVAADAMQTMKTTKETGNTIEKDVMKNVTTVVSSVKANAVNGTSVLVWDGILSSVHLIALSVAYGKGVWVTFVSSRILTRSLSRRQLGIVQSKIYPVYYRSVGYGVSIALVTHMLGGRLRFLQDAGHLIQALNLMAAVVMNLANLIYFEPRATRVMFERMKVEKEEGTGRDAYLVAEHSRTQEPVTVATAEATTSSTVAGPGGRLSEEDVRQSRIPQLSDRLKKLNAYTTILNMLTLACMTWHLVYLGRRHALSQHY